MKKLILFLLTLFICLFVCVAVSASDNIKLYVNGDKIVTDVSPVIVNGRTLVPARSVFEKLGAEVKWVAARQQILITSDAIRIVLNIGSDKAYINNRPVGIDIPPEIFESRTFIPVRFVVEKLGHEVMWNDKERAVYITANTEKEEFPSVDELTVDVDSDTTVVSVKLSNFVRPSVMYLTEPNRFIADFYGAELKLKGSKKEVKSKSVKEVRFAIHPEYTRIVVESPDDVSYKIGYSSDTMFVTVTHRNTNKDEEALPEEDKEQDIETDDEIISEMGNILIVIDAGHGGHDVGATGYNEDGEPILYESEINLKVAVAAKKYLNSQGIDVIMTRTDDRALGDTEMEDLLERSRIANESAATMFVSIHSNSFEQSSANGTEILYADNEDKIYNGFTSKELAKIYFRFLLKQTD